jgi:hypothetical protein
MSGGGIPTQFVRTAAQIAAMLAVSGLSLPDNKWSLYKAGDATALQVHSLSGYSTGTTRTITWPNASGVPAISATALTSGRVPFVTAGGLLTDATGLKYSSQVLTVGDGVTSGSNLFLDGAAGNTREVRWLSGGIRRWRAGVNTIAEGGADAGSNWFLEASTDAGAIIDVPISVVRAAGGTIQFNRPFSQVGAGAVALSGATTVTNNLTIGDATTGRTLFINSPNPAGGSVVWQSAGSNRWILRGDSVAESGANAGSNLELLARTDAGAALATYLTITRSSGLLTYTGSITQTGATNLITGTGSVSLNGNTIVAVGKLFGIGNTNAAALLNISSSATGTSGVNQYGLLNGFTSQSGATGITCGVAASPTTLAAAYTTGSLAAFWANVGGIVLGAGSSATRTAGLAIQSITVGGTANHGIYYGTTAALAGSGNWLLYNNTSDPNYLGNGATLISSPTSASVVAFSGTGILPGLQLNATFTAGCTQGIGQWINDTAGPNLIMSKSRGGAVGTHAVLTSGDRLGSIIWDASDGTVFQPSVRMYAQADGASSAGAAPGKWFLATTPAGSATPADRLSVDALGQVLALSPLGGLGYGTGAGGTVTQITSKATGVTLNKVVGAITLNAASLAATTSVGFTLTNSAIAAADAVLVSVKSGATADAYTVTVDAVAAGSCRISIRNVTAGALAEAVVLTFAVIKGATA